MSQSTDPPQPRWLRPTLTPNWSHPSTPSQVAIAMNEPPGLERDVADIAVTDDAAGGARRPAPSGLTDRTCHPASSATKRRQHACAEQPHRRNRIPPERPPEFNAGGPRLE